MTNGTIARRPEKSGRSTGRGSANTALPRSGSKRTDRSDLLSAIGFLTPFLALLLVFQYIPLAIMARDSTYQFSLFNPDAAKFVGADNFVRVFTNPATMQSMGVTLLFIVGVVVLVVPCGFLLAVFLNGRLPARALIRVMVFLPVVTSAVVVSTMWTFMLGQHGLINSTLNLIGVPSLGFLTDVRLALPAIVVMSVWQQVGLAAVLFLGGLQSVPLDIEEAASVDGASPLRRLVSITIPLVSRTTLLVVVVMTVFALQAFAPAYVMTGGAPDGTTNLIIYQIYKAAFVLHDPGYASALSIIVLVFALAVSLIQMQLLKTRWNY